MLYCLRGRDIRLIVFITPERKGPPSDTAQDARHSQRKAARNLKPFGASRQNAMQGTNNCLAVCRKTSMPQFQSVSGRRGLEIVRKVILAGHCCAIDQQGDDRNLSLECTREFDANVILRQIKFTVPLFVSCVKPAWSDDGEQNVTFCNLLVELLDKVEPRLHRVDIHEYIALREILR